MTPLDSESSNKLASEKRQLGNVKFQQKDFKEALELYTEALELLRIGNGAKTDASKVLTNMATCHFMLGEMTIAIQKCNDALQLDPLNAKTYHRKALAFAEQGHFDLALRCYQDGLDAPLVKGISQKVPVSPPSCPSQNDSLGTNQTKESQKTNPTDVETGLEFLRKQLTVYKSKTNKLSAQDKINKYVTANDTVLGCPVKLSASLFDFDKMLGEGNYSNVYKVTFKATGERFAMKIVEKEKAERMSRRHPNIHNEVKMERNILYRLQETEPHPNVVKLFHTFQDNSKLYFVMELANGGELWSRMRFGESIDRMVGLSESETVFFSAQLVNALSYLARFGVVHRDIKPENMMLFFSESVGEERIVFLKLIDFGTAKDLVNTELNGPNFVGTPEYMSPEVIRSEDTGSPSDLWSFGCTVFQMLSGTLPFRGGSPYLTFLKAQAREFEMPPYFSEAAKDLVDNLLQLKPDERLGAFEPDYQSIKQHKFFKGIDFELLTERPVLPVGTLFEKCTGFIGSTIIHTSTLSSKKRVAMPEWAHSASALSQHKFPKGSRVRAAVMGYLAQRGVLGRSRVFPLFYNSATESRFQRAIDHQFIGYTQQEEGGYTKPFVAVQVGGWSTSSSDAMKKLTRKLSLLEPRPRLVVFTGGVGHEEAENWQEEVELFQKQMEDLHISIPVVCVPQGHANLSSYKSLLGDDYFSFFVGGALIIVTNSQLLQQEWNEFLAAKETQPSQKTAKEDEHQEAGEVNKPHIAWFERQLLLGKVCARHVLVVSRHRWFEKSPSEESSDAGDVLKKSLRDYFFPKMLDANTHMILCAGPNTSRVSVPPMSDLQQKMWQAPVADVSSEKLRVIRVFSADVVSDTYSWDELPSWLSMKDENVPDSEMEDSDSDDSISSDSSG